MLKLMTLLAFLAAHPVYAFAPSPDGQSADPFSFLGMILMFFGIFYFIVIRPQQREQKQHQQRINNVQRGDKVITSGGIHGVIRDTKEKTLVLEIADGVKVTINRQAIASVIDNNATKPQ